MSTDIDEMNKQHFVENSHLDHFDRGASESMSDNVSQRDSSENVYMEADKKKGYAWKMW